jgi:hypothetical protein
MRKLALVLCFVCSPAVADDALIAKHLTTAIKWSGLISATCVLNGFKNHIPMNAQHTIYCACAAHSIIDRMNESEFAELEASKPSASNSSASNLARWHTIGNDIGAYCVRMASHGNW